MPMPMNRQQSLELHICNRQSADILVSGGYCVVRVILVCVLKLFIRVVKRERA